MADRVLQVRFVGNTSDLTGNVDGVSSRFGVLAKGVAAAGAAVGASLVGVGAGLLSIGTTFDDVSDTIRTQTGATGQKLEGLVDVAKNVGTQVPSSFEEVSQAVAGLSQRLGIGGAGLEKLSAQVLDLSRITGTDLQANIEGITRVFGDWGIKTEDQAGAMDKIFRASQQTGAGIGMLTENVVKFGVPLRQLGFSFEESLAILGKFEKEGVNTELVLGSMRKSLGTMAKAGEEPIATFQRVVAEIKHAGDAGRANSIALELFGAKAGPEMAAAIREGRFSIEGLAELIADGSDTISSAAADTADFAESWQVLKNKAFVALEPVATRVFGLIGEKMDQLAGWFDANKKVVEGLVSALATGFGIALDVIGVLVDNGVALGLVIASVASWISDRLVPALIILSPILLPLSLHFAALGVQAVIAAAKTARAWLLAQAAAARAAVVHGLVVLRTIGGWALMAATATAKALVMAGAWVIGFAAGAAIAVATMVATAARVVAQWAIMAAGAMAKAAVLAAAWIVSIGPIGLVIAAIVGLVALIIANWETVTRWTAAAWAAVSGFIGSAWEWIKTTVARGIGALKGILGWFGGLGQLFRGWWDGAVRAVADKIAEVVGWVRGIQRRVWDALGDFGGWLVGVGRDIVNGLWRGISAGWDWLVAQVRALARRLLDAAKAALGIGSPSTVFRDAVGRWIPEGMAIGISANTESVRRAVQSLTAASVPQEPAVISRPRVGAAETAVSAAGRLSVSLTVTGGADQAIATLIMTLVREGKLQLSI